MSAIWSYSRTGHPKFLGMGVWAWWFWWTVALTPVIWLFDEPLFAESLSFFEALAIAWMSYVALFFFILLPLALIAYVVMFLIAEMLD